MNKSPDHNKASSPKESYTNNQQAIIYTINSYLKRTYILLLCTVNFSLFAQNRDSLQFTQYRYDNGQISSEGHLLDGQPEGYWKSYYPTGVLKSEGNRKDHFLDGPWKFYNEEGELETVIRYLIGEKNGIRETWRDSVMVAAVPYLKNKQDGLAKYFYPDGSIEKWVPYIRGREQGKGYHFAPDGTVDAILTYKSGVLVQEQEINRVNRLGLKQGVWIDFYASMDIRVEGTYKDDLKHGYWKYYQRGGNLIRIEHWIMGVLQEADEQTTKIDIRREIHPSTGEVASIGAYQNDKKEGVHQQFDEDGNPIGSQLYHQDVLLAEGMYDQLGRKQGEWKYFYEDGSIKAIGNYVDDFKNDRWKYYFRDSTIEQVGRYILDYPDGTWEWYFEDGSVRKTQEFLDGLENGPVLEYNDSNQVILRGQYVDGLRTGTWIFTEDKTMETGEFVNDLKEGTWITRWIETEQIRSQTEWINGVKEGNYVRYFENGQIQMRGKYSNDKKQGIWEYFATNGARIVTVEYDDDVELKYNGNSINR